MNPEEQILVVPKETFESIPIDSLELINKIELAKKYIRRGDVEENPDFKQIIPYVVLFQNNLKNAKIYVTHRVSAGDSRLRGKYSVGVGGHIREPETIVEGMYRELMEEVGLDPAIDIPGYVLTNLILIDKSPVDKVHAGIVYYAYGKKLDDNLECLEDELEGQWMSLDEIIDIYDSLEDWSKIVIDDLAAIHPEE